MRENISRRGLFNRLRGKGSTIRLPWALPTSQFLDQCSRCDACIKACGEGIVRRGDGGYPEIVFSQAGCTFCGACAEACGEGCFHAERDDRVPWSYVASVGEDCLEHRGISCRACESWCEERAIRFRPALGGRTDIRIETTSCTGCGACVAPCPQNAISITEPQLEEAVA